MKCALCGADVFDDKFAQCSECGADLTVSANVVSIDEKKEDIEKIQLTTAQTLENYKIIKTIEIVSAECVCGLNFLSDFLDLTDIFNGRGPNTQKILRTARKTCLYELKREAFLVGANAVIAVDLDYSDLSWRGEPMLFLVASGTAVIVESSEAKNES